MKQLRDCGTGEAESLRILSRGRRSRAEGCGPVGAQQRKDTQGRGAGDHGRYQNRDGSQAVPSAQAGENMLATLNASTSQLFLVWN